MERTQRNPEVDTLTDWFIHEANNAFGMLQVAEVPPELEDYVRGQKRLVGVRRGLDWFVHDGLISRAHIEAFLEEAEQKPWDQSRVEVLAAQFDDLIKPLG